MKVLIDARLPNLGAGGVQQVVKTLAKSISEHTNSDELSVTWLVFKHTDWWVDSFSPNHKVIEVDQLFGKFIFKFSEKFPHLVSRLKPLIINTYTKFSNKFKGNSCDMTRGFDLIHFPFQDGFVTDKPFIYHPHDLQHLYFPKNFTRSQIKFRENHWRNLAQKAKLVVVESNCVKNDLISNWGIDREKIRIVVTPPSIKLNDRNLLPPITEEFLLYPAAFWQHKNHKNLLLAINFLDKKFNLKINTIFTGAPVGNFREANKLTKELKITELINFMGHVSDDNLENLYRNAKLVVVPSLFESVSLPIWEAMALGVPVLGSEICGIKEQITNKLQLFDPNDYVDIAMTIKKFWTDENLRLEISQSELNVVKSLNSMNFASEIYNLYQLVSSSENDFY